MNNLGLSHEGDSLHFEEYTIGTDMDDATVEGFNREIAELQAEARETGRSQYLVIICKP